MTSPAKPRRWLILSIHSIRQDYLFRPNDELFFLIRSFDMEGLLEDLEKHPPQIKYQILITEFPIDNNDNTYVVRPNDREIVKFRLNELDFCQKLDDFRIDAFFSYTTFAPMLMQIRNILLNDNYFSKIMPIWKADHLLMNEHFDWMGTLQNSSLAKININNIPDINADQTDVLDQFMTTVFLPQKIDTNKICVRSIEGIQDTFKTKKPVAVILQQVIGDTALITSTEKKYHDYTWTFDFISKHPDVFFIVKDHPEQHFIIANHPHENFWNHHEGENWVYLPPNSKYDTLSLSMNADFAITFNSRAGIDTLYWTTLVSGGDRYRHKEICYYPEDFHANAPPKKRSDVLKFMYYLITRCLFIPGINGDEEHFDRWLDWTNEYRLSVGISQTNLKQATLQELNYLSKR